MLHMFAKVLEVFSLFSYPSGQPVLATFAVSVTLAPDMYNVVSPVIQTQTKTVGLYFPCSSFNKEMTLILYRLCF